MDDYITEREVVAYLKGACALNTLRCWRSANKGPRYYKLGRKIYYRKADLDQWAASRVVETEKLA